MYLQNVPDFIAVQGKFPNFFDDTHLFASHQGNKQWDAVRWLLLQLCLERVRDLPEGEYAELGTHQGTTGRLIFEKMAPGRTLYCFDTFEGFALADLTKEREVSGVAVKAGHFANTSLQLVNERITGSRVPHHQLVLVKGFFPDSFAEFSSTKWRFVQLDADLYAPMKAGLEKFWPQLVPGGILVIHDYNGTYLGTAKAVDEFFADKVDIPIPMPDKAGTAVVVKPKCLPTINGSPVSRDESSRGRAPQEDRRDSIRPSVRADLEV